MSTSKPSVAPRLIRPSKDGQEGEWSYLFHSHGQDYIFPAMVNELGSLSSLLGHGQAFAPTPQEPPDPYGTLKVIYWKASEWETKILPHAVAWMDSHGFEWPDIPFPYMELRKIEDRDGEERVTEVVNLFATDERYGDMAHALVAHQFREVEGEEGRGRRPLMQWWSEGMIDFKGGEPDMSVFSVSRACERIAGWGRYPEILRGFIEEKGPGHFFKVLSAHAKSDKKIYDDELRLVVLWVAFCRYITSLKTTYEEGLPQQGRRRSAPKTTEEALALEQAEIFKTVAVLKSGVRKKPIATGTGTLHRYRYLVRGHERIINGKSIWIKPQIRGQGEFLNRATGTEEAKVAADVIEPPASVSVQAEGSAVEPPAPVEEAIPEIAAIAKPDETPAATVDQPEPAAVPVDRVQPPPRPGPPRRKPSLVRSAVRFVLSFFRRRP